MRTAEDCAKLILINMAGYNKKNGENIDSFLISKKTIKILSDRLKLKQAFLELLEDELFELGYIFLDFGDEENRYAVISLDKIYNYKKIPSKYAKSFVDDLDDSEDINDSYNDLFGEENIENDQNYDED